MTAPKRARHRSFQPITRGGENMHALSFQELSLESGELLPSRETLDFVHINVAEIAASNSAAAANVGTVFSQANAAALQAVIVTQS
jgi:hypothetical protein